MLRMSEKERDRLKVISDVDRGLLKQWKAAELLGLSVRQVRRIQRRYECQGDAGLIHGSRGAVSPHKIPQHIRDKAVKLVRDTYEDFGPTLAAEKLKERDGIEVSRETLRQWMIEAELWTVRRRKVKPSPVAGAQGVCGRTGTDGYIRA